MDFADLGDQSKLAYELARILVWRGSLELVPVDGVAIGDRLEQLFEVVGRSWHATAYRSDHFAAFGRAYDTTGCPSRQICQPWFSGDSWVVRQPAPSPRRDRACRA